ncbi:MAG TPA: stage III sporulation protein AA [Clostridiales bacterium]|nr:stage III sporulation protein AA [Clostridiales bacterium]
MDTKEELFKIFSIKLRVLISNIDIEYDKLQEFRLRINSPLIVIYNNKEYFITKTSSLSNDIYNAFIISKNEIRETMEYISNYSLYAFEEEIKQGFITISGGHRIGISGKVIVENDFIKTMKHISFINIRLAHQIKGCADNVIKYLLNKKENRIYHTLIISPPRCGKTTLLRDIIRQLSNGSSDWQGMTIGVVDERSEIASCYQGVPQNDVGIRTDILDCCPKAKGMMMMIRSMSPQIIAVDEIGSKDEIEAIKYSISCGCKLIVTVHGDSIEDIKSKPVLSHLLSEEIFERYILLSNRTKIGKIENIYDSKCNTIF